MPKRAAEQKLFELGRGNIGSHWAHSDVFDVRLLAIMKAGIISSKAGASIAFAAAINR